MDAFRVGSYEQRMMTILLLPFAALHQDEATAKLCRQIPRLLGAELERALGGLGVSTRFLSSRGTSEEGRSGLVASLELPAVSDLETTARMFGADLIVTGRFGLTDRNLILEARIYDAAKHLEVYAKHFETYPAYYFDSIEELKVRVVQTLGIELGERERVALMSRATESWEALLHYLLAEDERYALSLGIAVLQPMTTLDLFRDALRIDPEFTIARSAMEHYIVLLVESGLEIDLRTLLATYEEALSPEFVQAMQEFV
jgi:hypothetical protein